jgi:hypothetical protein
MDSSVVSVFFLYMFSNTAEWIGVRKTPEFWFEFDGEFDVNGGTLECKRVAYGGSG